jgi:hypothetical protein
VPRRGVVANGAGEQMSGAALPPGGNTVKCQRMAVAQDIYAKVYSGDWAAFTAKADVWHGRKRRPRARS